MPGAVIQGHAKVEEQCARCHVRFERDAQPRLCLDCHKPVAADVRAGRGFHGRIEAKPCRDCHTEHKGRAARIVSLDEKTFDHARSDFRLRGKHAQQPCRDCHDAGAPHRKAPTDCVACHREDDEHRGNLGTKCGNCHDENDWKKARFDHAKTKFALRHAHADLACDKCHVDQRYAKTPRDCLSCHRDDDAHKGAFGARCETCHAEDRWERTTFRHDIDTRFRLLGEHRAARCADCHAGPLYRQKTPTRCHDCHRRDDVHKGGLGPKCESCHQEKTWKTARFDHDRDARFALRDKHASAKCHACHKPAEARAKLPTTCQGCHAEDDQKRGHKGRYGEKCASCHDEKSFKPSTFAHDRDTRYPLRDKHRPVKCDACHKGPSVYDKLDRKCFACHERDDMAKGHKGRYGEKCETCHVEHGFTTLVFEHDRDTSYPLTGKHRTTKCADCHVEPLRLARFLAAPARDRICLDCHKDDDVHFGSYNARCDECHVTADWREVIKRPGKS